MQTPICPTCGCSLVRLGITTENATVRTFRDVAYSFCCGGCADLFESSPEALLEETKGLVVCPSCLAEKPVSQTVSIDHAGEKNHFCRCPYCITVFREDPGYYLKRLSGEIEFSGVFTDGRGCCP